MKKAAKIILPILLVIAILVGTWWYLFVYDTELTRDILLSCARHYEAQGDHATAAWFYDLAYDQTGENDAVAIELANHHKAAGNYTQAEVTLSGAIADGCEAQLYVELCKLYLEQDKILDAVKLLDAVCSESSTVDPAVRSELMAMRPKTPTVSLEPGFYSQYVNVTVQCESGTLYVNPNGQYPSISKPAALENGGHPVALQEGENSIYALCVSEEGLISSLAIYGYTIGGVIEQVSFADPAVEASVRSLLNLAPTTAIYTNDLWKLTQFTVPEGTKSLADLKNMINLQQLEINAGPSEALSFLSSMPDLTKLVITDTTVSSSDLPLIGNLPKLEELTLHNCGLSTTAGLEPATKLTRLDLSQNTIRNITALSGMSQLSSLQLQNNALDDLSALSGLRQLRRLDVSYNTLSSLEPVSALTGLEELRASNNTVSDVSSLKGLSGLKVLSLGSNALTDVSALAGCTGLTELDISSNTIADITSFATLNQLMLFNFSHNQVTQLPKWDSSSQLVQIDGSHNLLESLEELSGMSRLNNVFMDYNPELESITCLAKCHLLIQVNVYGTKVKDITALTEMSVIVNYDPTN